MTPKEWLFDCIKSALAFAEINGNWPSRYLKPIYTLSWKLFFNRANPASRKLQLWPRNSFAFDQFVPGLSDIDITIVSEITPSYAIQQWQLLKHRFPWFGEINYYPLAIVHALATLANPGELNRDPELLRLLGKVKLSVNLHQKITVLCRMLQHDHKALASYPIARRPKWKYGLEQLNFDQSTVDRWISQLSLSTCINQIAELAPLEERSELADELSIFNDQPSWLLPQREAHKPEMKAIISQLSPWKKQIVMEQCYWEFWGVMTQTHWLPKSQILPHLMNVKGIMDSCEISLPQEKSKSIDVVFNYLKNLS